MDSNSACTPAARYVAQQIYSIKSSSDKAGSSPDTHNHVANCRGCNTQICSQAPRRRQRDAPQWLIAWQPPQAVMCDRQTCLSSCRPSCNQTIPSVRLTALPGRRQQRQATGAMNIPGVARSHCHQHGQRTFVVSAAHDYAGNGCSSAQEDVGSKDEHKKHDHNPLIPCMGQNSVTELHLKLRPCMARRPACLQNFDTSTSNWRSS